MSHLFRLSKVAFPPSLTTLFYELFCSSSLSSPRDSSASFGLADLRVGKEKDGGGISSERGGWRGIPLTRTLVEGERERRGHGDGRGDGDALHFRLGDEMV